MTTNYDYNKIQINYSQDKTADGKTIKQSLMLNIRAEEVGEAFTLYQELMNKIDGKDNPAKEINQDKEDGPKRKTGKESAKKESSGVKTPTCECGAPMILRNGKWGSFWSCSSYPICRLTKKFQDKKALEMPCDQDIDMESMAF